MSRQRLETYKLKERQLYAPKAVLKSYIYIWQQSGSTSTTEFYNWQVYCVWIR
jgi:hypothetical protein